jgi:hypothetical protein
MIPEACARESALQTWPRMRAVDALVERFAGEQLHDHVRPAVVRQTVVEDLDRVLAVERRRGAGLGHEARLGFLAVGVLRVDELDGDPGAEARVTPLPHGSHAAPTDEAQDLVLAGDEPADGRRLRLVHRPHVISTLDETSGRR